MSVTVMALVWLTDLPPAHKLVLLAYADHADDDGDGIYPGEARLAAKSSYSVSSVRRITRELLDTGLLIQVRRGWRGQRAEYAIDVPVLNGYQDDTLSNGYQATAERLSRAGRKATAGDTPNHQEPSQPSGSGDERERTLAAAAEIRGTRTWAEYLDSSREKETPDG